MNNCVNCKLQELKTDGAISKYSPCERKEISYCKRRKAAKFEYENTATHFKTNKDEENYNNFIGNFHKTLPHNKYGEVDKKSYLKLLSSIKKGRLEEIEEVPGNGRLLNPLGGTSFNLEGPDNSAISIKTPPSVSSAELAAQAGELYWMCILRDVPFKDYEENDLVGEAIEDLEKFSGYRGPKLTRSNLFRINISGVLVGPMVSQFLMHDFSYDGIPVDPKMVVSKPNTGFLTDYNEWLNTQNGFGRGFGFKRSDIPQYISSARDLGSLASQDTIYSAYLRALKISVGLLGFTGTWSGPYDSLHRQTGFATFGLAQAAEYMASSCKGERHAWWHKWNVHRFLRPEAYGGLVHNTKTKNKIFPIHDDILNSSVLDKIFEHNKKVNIKRHNSGEGHIKKEGTYLLPQILKTGSPSHPSLPAGHAISAGACTTILKAFIKDSKWSDLQRNPKIFISDSDPTKRTEYEGDDKDKITLHGELNKLAHNLSFGRDMSGVHWRVDNTTGLRLGEEVSIRILKELVNTLPEKEAKFEFTKFNGKRITIEKL